MRLFETFGDREEHQRALFQLVKHSKVTFWDSVTLDRFHFQNTASKNSFCIKFSAKNQQVLFKHSELNIIKQGFKEEFFF